MSKTKKYYLGITTYNTECVYVEITKKQFTFLQTKYDQIVESNHADCTESDTENYIEKSCRKDEMETYINEYTEYADGASYITLLTKTCKDGYVFKK